jgi:hypothetical protein
MKALHVAISVLLIAASAVAAAPCSVGVTTQPAMPVSGQPVSIHYGAIYRGFLDAPSIAIAGNQINIEQLTAVADPYGEGGVPCGERTVSVGPLSPGAYQVTVRMGFLGSMSGSFVVLSPRVFACDRATAVTGTGPASGNTSVSIRLDQKNVQLHFENQRFVEYVGASDFQGPVMGAPVAQAEGYRIVVNQSYQPPVPSVSLKGQNADAYSQFCQTEDIDLGELAPGTYTLIWTYLSPTGPVPVTLTFSNGSDLRRRSARH